MTPIYPILTTIAGVLMLISKARKRLPCFAGGCASIIGGSFILSLPVMDSMGLFGWVWFCLWVLSLPVMIACLIALLTILRKDQSVLNAAILCGFAIATAPVSFFSYWQAAGLGVVHLDETLPIGALLSGDSSSHE